MDITLKLQGRPHIALAINNETYKTTGWTKRWEHSV